MKSERKAPLLVLTEDIEMKLFCSVIQEEEEKEEDSFDRIHGNHWRHLEHPLVPEEEPEPWVQTRPQRPARPQTQPPAKVEAKGCPAAPACFEEIDIEMEVLTLSRKESDYPYIKASPSPNKVSRLKWKRPIPQKMGLVVKDVVCLPKHYLAQRDRHIAPRGKERAALAAMGMTARITIDCNWSANQMQSRLRLLFWGHFVKRAGQEFSFSYLQCVQNSGVLFTPETPAAGWSGEQVVRISGHGAVYIVSHQDYPQAESESSADKTSVVSRKEFCTDEGDGESTAELTPCLDSILRRFRQENVDAGVETLINVSRGDVLRGALNVLRSPGFSFSSTPIICFTGEETDSREGLLTEFFRLALSELQESPVFEGPLGRLLLTYDSTALEDRKYYEAGVLIGWSLAHGGPGPRCLHPALYQLMCGQNPPLQDFSWTDIVDPEVQMRLQQLHSCTDVKLLSPSLCDWISSCGIPGIYSAQSDEIPAIYVHLVKHHIYHRVASMVSQFTMGLNSCGGLWDTIRFHCKAFECLMTSVQRKQPPPLEELKQLFSVCYSPAERQLQAAEEETAQHWEIVLTSISDGQADFSIEDLLAFITGTHPLPPLGFPKSVSLRFYSQDESQAGVRLPYTSPSALELWLPTKTTTAADLLALLSRAVHEAQGVTRLQTEG